MRRESVVYQTCQPRRKERGGEAEKGLGVDLIPQLEEFAAFSCGQVGFLFSILPVCICDPCLGQRGGLYLLHMGDNRVLMYISESKIHVVDLFFCFCREESLTD